MLYGPMGARFRCTGPFLATAALGRKRTFSEPRHQLAYQPPQHPQPEQRHEHREDAPQHRLRQAVGEARAERGGGGAGDDDAGEGRQRHVAETPRRQAGLVPAGDDVAERAAHGDGQADGGRGADGAFDRHAAPGHERHRQRTAADAEQRRGDADERAGEIHADDAGQLGVRAGGGGAARELHGDGEHEHHEHPLQGAAGEVIGDRRAEQGTDDDRRRDAVEDGHVERAATVVRAGRGDGGEDDGRQRRAERQLHDAVRGDALPFEHDDQHRHDERAATDAEQAGHHAGQAAHDQ